MLKMICFLIFTGLSFFAYYFLIWMGINNFFNSTIDFPVIPALVASVGGAFYVWKEVYLGRRTAVEREAYEPENSTAVG